MLIPGLPLLKVILFSQVANGILLPFVLFYMLTLINRKRIMQEYTNNCWQNVIAWSTAVVMIALTAALVWTTLSRMNAGATTTTVISSAGGAPCVKSRDLGVRLPPRFPRAGRSRMRRHQFRQPLLAEILIRRDSRPR